MAPITAATSSEQLEAYKAQALRDFGAAQSYLNDKRGEVQERYVEPAVDAIRASAQRNPIATTFLGVFAALSFLPVASFLFFALGTVLVVGGGALIAATVIISWLVGSAALLLVGALIVTASIAAFTTSSLLAGYAVLRFFAILNRADTLPEALQQAQFEASALLTGTAKQLEEDYPGKKVRLDSVVKQDGAADLKLNESM